MRITRALPIELPTVSEHRSGHRCSAQTESPGIDAATPKGLISVFFGERLPDGSLRRTRKITWKPGNKYGWDVTVFAKEPSIKVKEILRLPAPAAFIKEAHATPALMKNRSDKISNDGQALEKEFTLDTSKPVKYGQTFTILDTDPKGAHRFQLFINGTLASDVEFEVAD